MRAPLITLALGTGLVGLVGLATTVAHAEPEPDDRIEIVALDRQPSSLKGLVLDSDGDGWTDWVERLEGTDPKDPSSHPQAVRVDVLDGSLYVQSSTFPDRFVVIDLATLPVSEPGIVGLADLVGQLTGQASLGKFVDHMTSSIGDLGGAGAVDEILADASTFMSSKDLELGARTGGSLVSLIAAGMPGMQTAKDNSFVDVDMSGGDVKVTVTTTDLDSSGTGNAYVKEYVNGRLVSSSIISYSNGVAVFGTKADGSGTPIDGAVVPLSSTPTATSTPATTPASPTTAPATTAPASTGSTTATTAPTSSPGSSTASSEPATSAPPTTEKGDYVNPDADQGTVVVTGAMVRERVAFLQGVNANYRPTIELPADWTPTKSGVADPADPECDQSACVLFTVFDTNPIDTSTAGACPTTFCTPGRP